MKIDSLPRKGTRFSLGMKKHNIGRYHIVEHPMRKKEAPKYHQVPQHDSFFFSHFQPYP